MENVLEISDLESDYVIDPESLKLALEFTKRYSRLLLERKEISEGVKDLKKEYEEQGLPTAIVVKAFSKIKSEKKEKNHDEIESFRQYISKNDEIMKLISELNT